MNVNNDNYKIKIEKGLGITHALKKLIEDIPNSIISDGKISSTEWNVTLDKLIEINEKRKSEGKESIFTGGTDKTKAGWKNSFIVQTDQEIIFTKDEIEELFETMGVTINNPVDPKDEEQDLEQVETEQDLEIDSDEQNDSSKVDLPKLENDSSKVDLPEFENDSTLVKPPVLEEDTLKIEVPLVDPDSAKIDLQPDSATSVMPVIEDEQDPVVVADEVEEFGDNYVGVKLVQLP